MLEIAYWKLSKISFSVEFIFYSGYFFETIKADEIYNDTYLNCHKVTGY